MSTVDLTSEQIFTSKGAAAFLELNYETFLNKRYRGDLDALPAYKMPNTRGYRYLKSDIIKWMMGFKDKPRRGRPRKAQ